MKPPVPEALVPRLLRFDTLGSTNAKARELAARGEAPGAVIVAASQTGGRGRGDRSWHSPEGGIYLSALLGARPGRRVTDLSFLAGIAVAETLRAVLPAAREISVKWPNDCLVDRKKISGVLGESLGEMGILGIGLNVNVTAEDLAPFRANPFPATSLLCETGTVHDLEAVLASLLASLFRWHATYLREGFLPLQQRWERHCAFLGKPVTVRTDEGDVRATCLGIDENGALVLSTERGERRHVHAGELVSLRP